MRFPFASGTTLLIVLLGWFVRPANAAETTLSYAAYDFVNRFSEARIENHQGIRAGVVTCNAVSRSAFVIPPVADSNTPVTLLFREVNIPPQDENTSSITLFWDTGFQDRAANGDPTTAKSLAVTVEINGLPLHTVVHGQPHWQAAQADLAPYAGHKVNVRWIIPSPPVGVTMGLADPHVRVTGRGPEIQRRAQTQGRTLPEYGSYTNQNQRHPPIQRIVTVSEDEETVTALALLDERLDLPYQLQKNAETYGPALVSLGPRLVAGEGPDPQNHTVVRILSAYGIAESQFLAYGSHVRGGVLVEAGKHPQGDIVILCAPLQDRTVYDLHLFNDRGTRIGRWSPQLGSGEVLSPPYRIAVGNLDIEQAGDEVAVVSQDQAQTIGIFTLSGNFLWSITFTDRPTSVTCLSPCNQGKRDRLLCLDGTQRRLWDITPMSQSIQIQILDPNQTWHGVYGSAFNAGRLIGTGPDPQRSWVYNFTPTDTNVTPLDVGHYENTFWMAWKPDFETRFGEVPNQEDLQYLRFCRYGHLRGEGTSPLRRNPMRQLSPTDHEREILTAWQKRNVLQPLHEQELRMWEPCFTHRQLREHFENWMPITDTGSGLSKYLLLDHQNRPTEYSEFQRVIAVNATYAPELGELMDYYFTPLRTFFKHWAPLYRQHPERVPSVEPCHEHEINSGRGLSIGDYNPAMIRGFHEYLIRLYGTTIKGLNARFGTPFKHTIDAPRNLDRGPWDRYHPDNLFFCVWVDYNRSVINRLLCRMTTEPLLAGIPAELIKFHQIPEGFALPLPYSDNGITKRITPNDWTLVCGTGYGHTRFGTFSQNRPNVQSAAQSSGFDNVIMGEYQPLTDEQEVADAQLQWAFNNGIKGVHALYWPATHDRGFNKTVHHAFRKFAAEYDRPRPGVTGGIGQIRPVHDQDRLYDIVAMGTGPQHTGLLKSIDADGRFEGSVYTIPFHAHVDVTPLPTLTELKGDQLTINFGPFNQLDAGTTLEICFQALSTRRNWLHRPRSAPVTLRVERDGHPLPGLSWVYRVKPESKQVRFVFRIQCPADGIGLVLTCPSDVEISELSATRQSDQAAFMHRGISEGKRHRGGITFDVLP